jgi:hypothetical protein
MAAQTGKASSAAATAPSSCSRDGSPTEAIVSSVAGFSTSSAPPSPATCSPRISSRVSMRAHPSRDVWGPVTTGRRALRPGRYRATFVATDRLGLVSPARTIRFRIVSG